MGGGGGGEKNEPRDYCKGIFLIARFIVVMCGKVDVAPKNGDLICMC
jgi:hypothetical protein